jgi:chromosome segregation ATPase
MESAQASVEQQIKKISKIPLVKTKKKDLQKELESLKKKVADALSHETKIIKHTYDEEAINIQLQNKIEGLEKKLGEYLKLSQERLDRIKELEQKIKRKASPKAQRDLEIKAKISELRAKYLELKYSGKYSDNMLKPIKDKLDKLKTQLEK